MLNNRSTLFVKSWHKIAVGYRIISNQISFSTDLSSDQFFLQVYRYPTCHFHPDCIISQISHVILPVINLFLITELPTELHFIKSIELCWERFGEMKAIYITLFFKEFVYILNCSFRHQITSMYFVILYLWKFLSRRK